MSTRSSRSPQRDTKSEAKSSTTTGSTGSTGSSGSSGGSGSGSGSAGSSDTKRRSRSRSPKRSSRSPKRRSSRSRSPKRSGRSRSRSRSSSGSDSDSSSSSDSESESQRKKREKKSKKKDRKKDKKHKKHKKSKSKEKEKHKKKKSKKSEDSASGSGGGAAPSLSLTSRWGMYGTVNSESFYEKSDEFQAWLIEVKRLNRSQLGRKEEKSLFSEFVEDYNTATFPSLKFYDLAKWEREHAPKPDDGADLIGLSDEDKLRVLKKKREAEAKLRAEQARTALMVGQLKQTRDSDSAKFAAIEQRVLAEAIAKPTIESIAKKRQEEAEAKIAKMKERFK